MPPRPLQTREPLQEFHLLRKNQIKAAIHLHAAAAIDQLEFVEMVVVLQSGDEPADQLHVIRSDRRLRFRTLDFRRERLPLQQGIDVYFRVLPKRLAHDVELLLRTP